MSDENARFVERLAWEGVIGGTSAVVLAIIFAVIAARLMWSERHTIGRGWAATFWALRVVAFSCALWMLAGPTLLRIERTSSQQSIAIFADGSESMDVVDPPLPTDAVRWALAVDGALGGSPLASCDRLSVSLGAALTGCEHFASQVAEHRATKTLQAAAASIAAAADRAARHANWLASSLEDIEEEFAERAGRIAAVVDGPVRSSLAEIRSQLDRSDRTPDEEFTMHVEQLVDSIASARRRALVLAADLAQRQADEGTIAQAEVAAFSRREKTARALDALEVRIEEGLADEVRVERFRFDRMVSPVSVEGGWAPALASLPLAEAAADELNSGAQAGETIADDGPATNISAVLERVAGKRAGRSRSLVMLFSDGRHNDLAAPPPQELAAQLANVPVYIVPIGSSVQQRDVLLHRVEAPTAVTEKDSAVIDVIVTSFDCAGLNSSVVLRHEGQEIDRKPVEFTTDRGDHRVRFHVAAKEVGWQEYVVEVEPVAEEDNTANNFQPVSFEVVRSSLRVLLADRVARWEHRYLNQLFRRDEHVEFDELLFLPRLMGTGALAARPEFPRDVEGWARYDVVILGDVGPQQLAAASQQALAEFVRKRGGHLVLVAGPNAMPAAFANDPLIELLPVEPVTDVVRQHGYTLRLTDEGRLNSALLIADSLQESSQAWQRIYGRFPVFGLSDYCRPKPTARTLIAAVSELDDPLDEEELTGDSRYAFLCWQRAGAGKVAYLAAPDTYRLRWRRGDRMHHRFWGQFLRWLTAATTGTGTELVRLQTDRTHYGQREPVEVTVWLKDPTGRPVEGESLHAEARAFDDKTRRVELAPDPDVVGRYFGTFMELPVGAYQIGVRGRIVDELQPQGDQAGEVNVASATISVRATGSIESLNTQSNRPLLEQLAQLTGGQIIPPTAVAEVLELASFAPEESETVAREPLWNRWSYMFVVLGCLFTEWIVRKGKGLL